MNIAKRTFIYNALLTVCIIAIMLSYMLGLLPGLYADKLHSQMQDECAAINEHYKQYKSYENISLRSPMSSLSLEIPLQGYDINIGSYSFNITLAINDPEMRRSFDIIRSKFSQTKFNSDAEDKSLAFSEELEAEITKLGQYLENNINLSNSQLFSIRNNSEKTRTFTVNSSNDVKRIDTDTYVISSSANFAEQDNTQYDSYICFNKSNDAIYLTLVNAMQSRFQDMYAVVLQSMPMLVMLFVLLILLFSGKLSKYFVRPLKSLAFRTEAMQERRDFAALPPAAITNNQDELALLSANIDALYLGLKESLDALDVENKRQELLLRATTHQLKTPLTAALLLIEGMRDKVGPYKNTEIYLPQLAAQLQGMRNIIDELLALNKAQARIKKDGRELSVISLTEVLQGRLALKQEAIARKQLQVDLDIAAKNISIQAEEAALFTVIDNVLDNAIRYSANSARIKITLDEQRLAIENSGAHIDEKLLNDLGKPFLNQGHSESGHGLGLYLAKSYAELMGANVSARNTAEGVAVSLEIVACENAHSPN